MQSCCFYDRLMVVSKAYRLFHHPFSHPSFRSPQYLLLPFFHCFQMTILMRVLRGLAFHSSLSFQNPNPKYLSLLGFVTLVFSAFTFNPSFLSIHFVTVCIPLSSPMRSHGTCVLYGISSSVFHRQATILLSLLLAHTSRYEP